MKIKLTLDDVTRLVRSHVSFPDNIIPEVEVEQPPAQILANANFVESVLRITRLEYATTYKGQDKIAAIKRLRELTGCSLAEAYSIEEPDAAIEFYLRYGKIRSQYTTP